jgi:aspartate/glutamate/glutamine transport system permease protein
LSFFQHPAWQLFWERLPEGVLNTLLLTIGAVLIALIEGAILAAARTSKRRLISVGARALIELGRAIPTFVLLFLIYFGFLSYLLPISTFQTAMLALGIHAGFFVAEILRSGIQSVPRGLIEAGAALGMSGRNIAWRIVSPISLRIMLPMLAQIAVGTLLGSSIASLIGVREITNNSRNIIDLYFATPLWAAVALTYFLVAFPLSRAFGRIEQRFPVHL